LRKARRGFKEGVPLYQREAFFIASKRPLQSEEGIYLFGLQQFQPTMYYLITHQPALSWLASVRYIPSQEGLGEAQKRGRTIIVLPLFESG